jgi:hypothetical protein
MKVSSALSPVPSSQGKGNANSNSNAASLISKEYLEAVSVLNEDTMNRACHLLMSAYDSDDANAESSAPPSGKSKKKAKGAASRDDGSDDNAKEQLLEMYYKCQESLTVIRKQQMLPPALAIAGNGNKKTGTNKMLPKRTVMTSKHGIHPSHKTTSSAIGLGVGALKQKGMMPMAMKRMASLNKLGGPASMNKLGGAAKTVAGNAANASFSGRGRSISPPQSSLRGEDSASAPPPSALSFLAKLNRDPNEAATAASGDVQEEAVDDRESTERSKKSKKKKKNKNKQKSSEDDGKAVEKDKSDSSNEEEDRKEAEDRESHRKKRRRLGKNDTDVEVDSDGHHDSPTKHRKIPRRGSERVSGKHPVTKGDDHDRKARKEEEEESSPPSSSSGSEEDDNDDGDTSADETYHGRSENSPNRRTSFSRKAKPDAETLVPPSKRRKTRHTEESEGNSEDDKSKISPSKRRHPRRASSRM